MIDDDDKRWLATHTAALVKRAGIEPYVAAPLVEATDQWFPDEWHPDDAGVARLARRVFEHAGLADVEIVADLISDERERGVVPRSVDATRVELGVDPAYLGDPLTIIAHLVTLAAVVFRIRHELEDPDLDTERRLIDLTALYLGFGILMTNAAYRYRASGEQEGYTAITHWSHDVQGALPAGVMAYALAMQLVARGATPGELRAVARQLETNQADVFQSAARQMKSDYVVLALDLPARSKWPAKRAAPAAPSVERPRLWRKEASIPTATVKSTNFLGHNTGRAVLRMTDDRRWEMAFLALFVSFFAVIPLAVKGYGGPAMGALVTIWILGFVIGKRVRRELCSDSSCGIKLPRDAVRCTRCAGDIAGSALPGENRLEAEERLGINQDDYDMDVGEASESGVGLTSARVHRDRNARVDRTDTRIR